jgi:hypothetical protein
MPEQVIADALHTTRMITVAVTAIILVGCGFLVLEALYVLALRLFVCTNKPHRVDNPRLLVVAPAVMCFGAWAPESNVEVKTVDFEVGEGTYLD